MPENFHSLYRYEELLRSEALELIAANTDLHLHLTVIESAMDLTDLLRRFPSEDEDIKVLKLLGIRVFNAFGASIKLALCGYSQNSALIMRDILETVFLIDMFSRDHSIIRQWRDPKNAKERDKFRPINVRRFLDDQDGFTDKKRATTYKMFSELAGHPSMHSMHMLRPVPGGDIVSGPFVEFTTLLATLSEMAKLAVQIGEKVSDFIPTKSPSEAFAKADFIRKKNEWVERFYRKKPSTHVEQK